jgi:hypothetical protein
VFFADTLKDVTHRAPLWSHMIVVNLKALRRDVDNAIGE